MHVCSILVFFFFKQKTAYEMRISDWSSDVCSSDLAARCLSALACFRAFPALRHLLGRHGRTANESAGRLSQPVAFHDRVNGAVGGERAFVEAEAVDRQGRAGKAAGLFEEAGNRSGRTIEAAQRDVRQIGALVRRDGGAGGGLIDLVVERLQRLVRRNSGPPGFRLTAPFEAAYAAQHYFEARMMDRTDRGVELLPHMPVYFYLEGHGAVTVG